MDERHKLGNLIIKMHNEAHERLDNTNLMLTAYFDDNVNPQNPVRVTVSNAGNILRQYHIHKGMVHAEYFFSSAVVDVYNQLVEKLKPTEQSGVHDFGSGFLGNGPNGGRSRSIKKTSSRGARDFDKFGREIAKECVESMLLMLKTFEGKLPAENRISVNI